MKGIKSILLVAVLSVIVPTDVKASEFEAPTKIRCTCYTSNEGNITASGESVREGIVAGKRDWLGQTAILYNMDMEIIGVYEFLDTGAGIDTDGDGKGDSIKNGKSIDVYRDSLQGCKDWVKQYGDFCYLQIIEGAEG